MLKKWITAALLITISLLLIIIAYLLYSGQQNDSNSAPSSSSSLAQSTSSSNSPSSSKTDGNLLSLDKIKSIFYQRYNGTSITSIEYEKTLFSKYYEITGVDDDTEYTLKINSDTGKVISHNKETLDADEANGVEKQQKAINFDEVISLKDAISKAENSAGDSSVEGWSLDKEDGTTQWEIALKTSNGNVSIKIDAKSGQVLDQETDD